MSFIPGFFKLSNVKTCDQRRRFSSDRIETAFRRQIKPFEPVLRLELRDKTRLAPAFLVFQQARAFFKCCEELLQT